VVITRRRRTGRWSIRGKAFEAQRRVRISNKMNTSPSALLTYLEMKCLVSYLRERDVGPIHLRTQWVWFEPESLTGGRLAVATMPGIIATSWSTIRKSVQRRYQNRRRGSSTSEGVAVVVLMSITRKRRKTFCARARKASAKVACMYLVTPDDSVFGFAAADARRENMTGLFKMLDERGSDRKAEQIPLDCECQGLNQNYRAPPFIEEPIDEYWDEKAICCSEHDCPR
jgi:hypothetical protein